MQPDIQALALTKALRQKESGGNYNAVGDAGTSTGAYQYQAGTWKQYSREVLGNEASMTPENQNAVTYGMVKKWKDSGLGPAEIAAKWNSGSHTGWENKMGTTTINGQAIQYNVPQYVSEVVKNFKTIYPQEQTKYQQQTPVQPQQQENTYGATFQSSPTDSPIVAGLKTIGNLPSSVYNFGKGVLNSINPINIGSNLAQIPQAFNEAVNSNGGISGALFETAKALPVEAYNATVPEAGRALLRGDFQTAQKAITEDPVGQIAPFLLGAESVGKGIDTITGKIGNQATVASRALGVNAPVTGTNLASTFDSAITATARPFIDTAKRAMSAPVNMVSGVVKSASSHVLGMEPKTIETIIKNPEAFSKLQQDQISRGGLANEFGSAIDQLEANLNEAGTAYNPIRQVQTPVAVPENFISGVFDKFGLKLDNGQVIADTKSITRNTSDIKALQNFVDNWGDKTTLTPAEYLNMRKDIAGIAKFGKEIGTNLDAQKVGTELYSRANESIRPQINGLKALDEQYSPIRQQFDQIKRDFLKKDVDGGYTFKDGAVNKIANALGVGKGELLARMEEMLPGVSKKIEVLKAVEDIEKAYGNKVGTYTRGMLEGGGLLTGNIPAIIGAILVNPSIAVPLIRGFGLGANKIAPIIYTLKLMAGDSQIMKSIGDIKSTYIPVNQNPSQGTLK